MMARADRAASTTWRPTLGVVLVWMDLEMTGLDHTSDVIVEIATIVTDDDLNDRRRGSRPRDPPAGRRARRGWTRSSSTCTRAPGLLDAIKASTITLEDAGAATLEFIKQHVPEPITVPLCGNSIGTDRRFLTAYLPDIENYLHYRSIDVSSVKELVKRWYPSVDAQRPHGHGSHRALDDIRESIREMAYYREHVFVDPTWRSSAGDAARRRADRDRRHRSTPSAIIAAG